MNETKYRGNRNISVWLAELCLLNNGEMRGAGNQIREPRAAEGQAANTPQGAGLL